MLTKSEIAILEQMREDVNRYAETCHDAQRRLPDGDEADGWMAALDEAEEVLAAFDALLALLPALEPVPYDDRDTE